jgi:hypothetical protein
VCESQALIPATFALPFLIALTDRKLAQQMFFLVSVCLWGLLLVRDDVALLGWHIGPASQSLLTAGAVATALCCAGLCMWTRTVLGEWRAATGCAALFLFGVSFCFLLPVFSMTTPPVNWGYPRTVEGFFHVLSRGQFSPLEPVGNFGQLVTQWKIYLVCAVADFGVLYLLAGLSPLFFLQKMSLPVRRWIVGLLLVWVVTTLVMTLALNANEYGVQKLVSPYFVPTRAVLAILAGCGLFQTVRLGRESPQRR